MIFSFSFPVKMFLKFICKKFGWGGNYSDVCRFLSQLFTLTISFLNLDYNMPHIRGVVKKSKTL